MASASGGIFISYRRQETAWAADLLYRQLRDQLGREQIFKDIDNIEPGDDFFEVISTAVGSCRVLLTLIGKDWTTTTDAGGTRRLDDPADFVRLELQTALERGVRVIPVLIDGATMPRADELPATLAELSRRHAVELTLAHFDSDFQRILGVIARTLASPLAPRPTEEVGSTRTPGFESPDAQRDLASPADGPTEPDEEPISVSAQEPVRTPAGAVPASVREAPEAREEAAENDVTVRSTAGGASASPGVRRVLTAIEDAGRAASAAEIRRRSGVGDGPPPWPGHVRVPAAAPFRGVPPGLQTVLAVGALVLLVVHWPNGERAWIDAGSGTAQARTWLEVSVVAALLMLAGSVAAVLGLRSRDGWVCWAGLGVITGSVLYAEQAAFVVVAGGLTHPKDAPATSWWLTLVVGAAMIAFSWFIVRPRRRQASRGPLLVLPLCVTLVGVVVVAATSFVRGISTPYAQPNALYVLVGREELDTRDLVLLARPLALLVLAGLLLFGYGSARLRPHHVAAAATCAALGAVDLLGARYQNTAQHAAYPNGATLIAVGLAGLAVYGLAVYAAGLTLAVKQLSAAGSPGRTRRP